MTLSPWQAHGPRFFILGLSLLLPVGVQARLLLNEQFTYYPIYGKTIGELRANLSQVTVQQTATNYDAYTQWHIGWRYELRHQHHLCYLSNIDVTLSINFILPQWKNIAEADTDLKHQWYAYLLALKTHEQGHRQLALEAARNIEQALFAFARPSLCQTLREKSERKAYEILQHYRQLEHDYDVRTQHGVTQGAFL